MKYVKLWGTDAEGGCKCPQGAECPPKRRGKHPVGASWEVHELEELELGPEYNWGLVTGEVNGIIVVDCDVHGDVNGVAALGALGTLPTTYTVKTGSGGLHYYLKWPGAAVTNSASKLAPGVDVRGDGGYVLVPPSRNAKGPYVVACAAPVADAPAWLLQRLTAKPSPHLKVVPDAPIDVSPEDIAAARAEVLMMAPAVDGKGGDNQTYLVAATLVNDYALPEEIGFPIFREWNARCQPPWSEKDLLVKYRNGGKYATGKRGVKLAGGLRAAVKVQLDRWRESNLGEAGLGALVKGLERAARENPIVDKMVLDNLEEMVKAATGLPPRKQGLRVAMQSEAAANKSTDRKVIIWEQDSLAECVVQADAALCKSDVFRRAGALVIPKGGLLNPIPVVTVQCELNKVVALQQLSAKSMQYVRINPPDILARGVMAYPDSVIPEVTGVLRCPSLRPDGSIINARGVDPGTRLFLETPLELPPVGSTREEALAALERLEYLISESAFVTRVDRAVALSMILTPICQGLYDVAPGHGVSACAAGSGKSFLARVAAAIALGTNPGVVDMAEKDPSELDKRLLAELLEGPAILAIDNVKEGHPLGGSFLCQVVEQPVLKVRPLGQSKSVKIDKRCMLTATGINLAITADSTRRWLMTHLDTHMENPEDKVYSRNSLKAAYDNRVSLISDALTVVRAFILEKGPKLPPLGSFGDWSDSVRSALVWLGQPDPVDSLKALKVKDESRQIHARVIQWGVANCSAWKRPKEWFDLAEGAEWLDEISDGRPSVKQLAVWLSAVKGKQVDGYIIAQSFNKTYKANVYRVEPAQPADMLL